jgi:hypothetical protein
MDHITNTFIDIYRWAERDYREWPVRFYIEVLAWAISIGNSLVMAFTVPNPPLIVLYPIWIIGCAMYGWAAWTRGSFGMLANYILLVTIDSIGLSRMIMERL